MRLPSASRLLLPAVLSLVALSGCGGPAPGPGGSGNTAPSSSTAGSGAPALTQPELDTSKFMGNPCGLLTKPQRDQTVSGVDGAIWPDSYLGPACEWVANTKPAKGNFSVTINTRSGNLDGMYGQRATFAVFEPTQVSGYPSVVAMTEDLRGSGTCNLDTRVAKDVMIRADVQLVTIGGAPADYTNPCPRAVRITELVIETLKAGG